MSARRIGARLLVAFPKIDDLRDAIALECCVREIRDMAGNALPDVGTTIVRTADITPMGDKVDASQQFQHGVSAV